MILYHYMNKTIGCMKVDSSSNALLYQYGKFNFYFFVLIFPAS